MTIFFGYYSIKIKTINLPEGKFGIYQRVYHLMFIPFFPKDQLWKPLNLHRETALNSDTRHRLNVIELRTKTPIWTYSGIGMIITAVLIPLLVAIFSWIGNESTKKIESFTRKNHNAELIETPQLGDIYHFKVYLVKPIKSPNGSIVKYEKVRFIFNEVSYSLSSKSNEKVSLKALSIKEFNADHDYYKVALKDEFTINKSFLKKLNENYKELRIGIYKGKSHFKIYAGLDKIIRKE